MYGFHCIPPFSKSVIYVNTLIIKIQGFNSNESTYCQSSIMRQKCVQNSLRSLCLIRRFQKKDSQSLGHQKTLLLGVHDLIISKSFLLQFITWRLKQFLLMGQNLSPGIFVFTINDFSSYTASLPLIKDSHGNVVKNHISVCGN